MPHLPRAVLALTATLFVLLGAGTASAAIPAGTVSEFSAGLTGSAGLGAIVAGPDGRLWFTESSNNAIGRMAPDGSGAVEFTIGITAGSVPLGIATGPDGNLW